MRPRQPLELLPSIAAHGVVLRPFAASDAAQVQRLAGAWAVARNCGRIPHPYPDGAAEAWIADLPRRWQSGQEAVWAVCHPVEEGSDQAAAELVGSVGLVVTPGDRRAELGYWIGEPFWGRRLGSAAAAAAVQYGFGSLGLRKICASVLPSNDASARICVRLGMRREGRLRQHLERWGEVQDLDVYGLLRDEWLAEGRASTAASS